MRNRALAVSVSLGVILGVIFPLHICVAGTGSPPPSNHAPHRPETPAGYMGGWRAASYTYYTVTNDSDGDQVKYYFDWGDGTGSWTELRPSDKIASASHPWSSTGLYEVRVRATDEHGAQSSWSERLLVDVREEGEYFDVNLPVGIGSTGPCGPATVQMWIYYKTLETISQSDLLNYIRAHNVQGDLYESDPCGLSATLEHYIGRISDFPIIENTDQLSAVRDTLYLIHRWGTPGASAVYNFWHWMLVTGAIYTCSTDLNVTGFYGVYVTDPADGIGYYYPATSWLSIFTPENELPSSLWYNKYVSVVCPCSDVPSTTFEIYEEPARGPVSENEAIEAAIKGFTFHKLFTSKTFSSCLDRATPIEPIYVESIGNNFSDYYLVPFVKNGRISVTALVNAESGVFMGAAPTDKYPRLSAENALAIVSQAIQGTVGAVKLVWKPCNLSWQPFVPFWAIEVGGKTIYIGQDGELCEKLSHKPQLGMITEKIAPTDDANVAEGYPDNNFGDRMSTYLQSYSAGYKNERIFLKFDLGEIPADSRIVHAELHLYCWRGRYDRINAQIRSVDDDEWDEMTITWNGQPALGKILNTVLLNNLAAENEWHSWNVTRFIKNQFKGDKVASFCLQAAMESVGGQYAFESKEWLDASLHPYLDIIYISTS